CLTFFAQVLAQTTLTNRKAKVKSDIQSRINASAEMRAILKQAKSSPAKLQAQTFLNALRGSAIIQSDKLRKKQARRNRIKEAEKQEIIKKINTLPAEKRYAALREILHRNKRNTIVQKLSSPQRIQHIFSSVNAETEPNGSAASANSTAYGVIMAGKVDSGNDEDWFSFSASAGDVFDAFAFAEEFRSPLDAYMTLYDTDGSTILTFNDDYEQDDPRILFMIPTNGTYYLQVTPFDAEQLGDYELSLTFLGAGAETEPNNSIATANVLSTQSDAAFGDIGQKDDSDYYAITVDAGATVGLRLESILDDATPDMVLAVYNAAGELVVVNDDHLGGRYFTSEIALKNEIAGQATYYLQATTYQSQEVGSYVISVRTIAAAVPGVFYAALGDSSGGRFLALEPATASGSIIGFTQFHGASALAVNASGEIFAARNGHEDTPFFRIDPVTGAGFGVAEIFDIENIAAIAFDAHNRLHAIDHLNQLHLIDFQNEDADFILTLPRQGGQFNGMAFDPETGKLFLASDNTENARDSEIWTVDLATGRPLFVGTTGLGSETSDLFFNRDGRLYGAKGGYDTQNTLFVINKSSGNGTAIGDIGFAAVDALASFANHINDVGVDAITAPVSGTSLGSAERITITLRNDGTIYQSTFDISLHISGPANATATENIGSLIVPAGGKAAYTFQATADLSAAGKYTVEIVTSLSGDINSANDTLRITIQSGTTAVGDETNGSVPATFALYQNYPNPFNPTTTIAFDLPKPEIVTVLIYNSVGQVVSTLVSQYYVAGQHRIAWDGKNANGFVVPSGLYMYKLQAGEFVSQRKLLLMR
ncbi:MAG: T9SS type A sorting domain-containing protein, partial [bacterium]